MKTKLEQQEVRTESPAKPHSAPRMPHERDESDDSQSSPPRPMIKQAYDDLEAGQVDTDLRGTSGVDEVVNHRPGTPPERVVRRDEEQRDEK
jgi:hypothetical protein